MRRVYPAAGPWAAFGVRNSGPKFGSQMTASFFHKLYQKVIQGVPG